MSQSLLRTRWTTIVALVLLLHLFFHAGCGASEQTASSESTENDSAATLGEALMFHAGFDDGWDAAFALGDRRLYSAGSYKEQQSATPGITSLDPEIVYDVGRFQHALKFNKKNTRAIFYRAQDNVAYAETGWRGTVSFWLSLDPAQDLEPGFCDPIQITDSAYNDACIWVDFTEANPRQFRLGVFGDLAVWNPEDIPPAKNPTFTARLVAVEQPPFARSRWTHVAITHEGLGAGQGAARLYLDGNLQGAASGIAEPFTWDVANAAIRLGVNYVGLFDELAIFNRPLTEDEIQTLHGLETGASGLRP
jgi:hypothetical protein